MEEMCVMTEIPDVAGWAKASANELRKALKNLDNSPVPKYLGEERLNFSSLKMEADAAIERLTAVDLIDRDRCLYVFALDPQADPGALKSAYNVAKKRGDLKLPQDNGDVSCILYVGSSCATKNRKRTLRNRLQQHLKKAPKGTYGLSLSEWTSDLHGSLVVSAWQYPSISEGLEGDLAARCVVLAVEDWLADELKPMLGRRGSRH
jgi:hypothetical protein